LRGNSRRSCEASEPRSRRPAWQSRGRNSRPSDEGGSGGLCPLAC